MWSKRSVSATTSFSDVGYPNALKKLCDEEDVLIIPQFVTLYTSKQAEYLTPWKSREFRVGELYPSTTNESKVDNVVSPPQVGIIYANPDDKETPIAIVCKNIYIEYSFINAIKKSLIPYPTISTLKIENCCISKEIIETLAFLLSDEPGGRITDISLDGNDDIAKLLPLYIILPTGIKYMSLQRCSLDDEDVGNFVDSLAFTDDKDHKLQVLNLAMNKIGNAGAAYLATALRTNRSLISVSLMGNQIDDEGASCLSDVLKKFPLTFEEVVMKRKRAFNNIFKKRKTLERYLEMLKAKKSDDHGPKSSMKGEDRLLHSGRRIRGSDGKIRCMPVKEQKVKITTIRTHSWEKFRAKERGTMEEKSEKVELTPSEISAATQQVESERMPDNHPFTNEVFAHEDELWCSGCWSLANINLAFNYLTENSAEYFTEVLNYQRENFEFPKMGLVRVVLMPGNSIQEKSEEFQLFQAALTQKNMRKDIHESTESYAVGSLTSSRRMSSSGRKIKNR